MAHVLDRPAGAGRRNERAEMKADPPSIPTRYAVREIAFDVVNGRLQFAFSADGRAQQLPEGGIAAVVADLLNPPAVPLMAAAAAPPVPQTPLDLDVSGDPIFLIYMLTRPGNLRFSSQLRAMTHKAAAHQKHYGGLRHVNGDGVSAEPLEDCRLIYFVAEPPAGPYRHGFNFNVELEQDPGPDGNPRILPLEIDPDIRHPGGSGTD